MRRCRRTRLAKHAVDRRADRAIAAMHHDEVDSVGHCGPCNFSSVATVSGLLDSQFEAAFQRMRQQVATGGGGGRGSGVDDQHGAHDA